MKISIKRVGGVILLLFLTVLSVHAQELMEMPYRPPISVNGNERMLPRAVEASDYVAVGDTMFTRSEFANYLKNVDRLAYKQYNEGLQWMITGWTLCGVAGALGLTGGIFMLKASAYQWEFTRDWMGDGYLPSKTESVRLFKVGTYFMYGAAGAGIASAPLTILGYQRMKGGVKTYNAHTQHVPAYWSLTASNMGGLGLAYNF